MSNLSNVPPKAAITGSSGANENVCSGIPEQN